MYRVASERSGPLTNVNGTVCLPTVRCEALPGNAKQANQSKYTNARQTAFHLQLPQASKESNNVKIYATFIHQHPPPSFATYRNHLFHLFARPRGSDVPTVN